MVRLLQVTLALSFILANTGFCQSAELELIYEWQYIDYLWDSGTQKTKAISTGLYNHSRIIPFDIQVIPDGRMLITTPKYFYNNPATLSVISSESGTSGPLLAPYPNWRWHKTGRCSGITSVQRVEVDDCGRVWMVDSGKIGNQQVCSPQILAFNATTDELLVRVEIPMSLTYNPESGKQGRLELQVIETTGDSCANTWAYISDMDSYGLVIWDGSDIWRLTDKVFEPLKEGETFYIAGENFTHRGGPEGMLLTPPGYLSQSWMLMKSLSYFKTVAATTEDLHNSKTEKVSYYLSSFTAPSQEPGKTWAKTGGVLFASFTKETALGCWNLQNPLGNDTVATVVQNDTTLQYVPSTKITEFAADGSRLLSVMSNRLQKFIRGTMDFSETNFRVMQADVDELVKGTVCESKNHTVVDTIEQKYFYPIPS